MYFMFTYIDPQSTMATNPSTLYHLKTYLVRCWERGPGFGFPVSSFFAPIRSYGSPLVAVSWVWRWPWSSNSVGRRSVGPFFRGDLLVFGMDRFFFNGMGGYYGNKLTTGSWLYKCVFCWFWCLRLMTLAVFKRNFERTMVGNGHSLAYESDLSQPHAKCLVGKSS